MKMGKHDTDSKIAFVVEEVGHGESVGLAFRRVGQFLSRDVGAVWILDPADEAIVVYPKGEGFAVFRGRDQLPCPEQPNQPLYASDFFPRQE